MRATKLLAVFAVMTATPGLLAPAACKSSDEAEEIAPLPGDAAAPAATPTPPPAATGTTPPATPTPAAPPATAKANPAQPAPAGASLLDAGVALLDAGAPKDAGATTDGGTKADAGALSTKIEACATKCQSILQSCLTPTFPADGGLPQLKDPKACEASFESCRSACAP
ncbi:hypothetical protein [Sorangium sp. So ce131]|uniref:hypothetical protein n=1 Tax=Sorangium sp. So ce131 TaxID=3133282 RepID=UPI003F6081CA